MHCSWLVEWIDEKDLVHLLCDFAVAAGDTSVIGLYRQRQTHPTAKNYRLHLRVVASLMNQICNQRKTKKEIGQLWLPEST
jgi:hypothetical protein